MSSHDELGIFFKGMLIGFSIAAPVGPIGVLCIRRSLADGPRMGLAAGLGAATADAAYGCVAGFGLSVVSNFLVGQQFWLRVLGGIFLCFLGVKTFLSRPASEAANARSGSLLATYASTLLLTLANPSTILSFVAVFAGFGLGAAPDYFAAAELVLGVFLGSALWWIILSSSVGLLRSRVNDAWMRAVIRFSGCILFGFGLFALANVIF